MQQTNQLCDIHQQPITNVCIQNHTCEDRRLCVQCLFTTHKVIHLQESAPLVDEFHNLLKIKLDEYQEDNFTPFLTTIQIIQSQMNQYFMEIKIQVDCMINQIKDIGKSIVSLKQKVSETPILECSRSDYNLMVDIINKNIIQNKNEERNQFKNQCHKQIQKLSDDCIKFNQHLNSMTGEMVKENLEGYLCTKYLIYKCCIYIRDVQIEGLQLFGLRHGDYYYINQDGTKTYAGQYSFGLKTGLWKDYLGFDETFKKRIYKDKIYKLGVDFGFQMCAEQSYYTLQNFQALVKYFRYKYQAKKENGLNMKENGANLLAKAIIKTMLKQDSGIIRSMVNSGMFMILSNSGKGCYNEIGQKIGKWVEPINIFEKNCQVTFSGEYKNGLKIGQWIAALKKDEIGGGTYDDRGIKIGNWTELYENFWDGCQVAFSGEYKNGIQVGQWITTYKKDEIGGGTYDDRGVKIGNWTELHENFNDFNLVTYSGEYKNGLKVGQWITTYEKDQIGGGSYDDKGLKIGNWAEPHESYSNFNQVTYSGEYKNGLKVGQWTTTYDKDQSGGGTYDDKGVKIGNWTELHKKFNESCLVTYNGEYKNGLKVGQWITTYKKNEIGGGTYDDRGLKIGNWKELDKNFEDVCQVIYSGEYKNGLKVGQWVTTHKQNRIGGGTYDDRGIKIGNWTELHETFYDGCQVIYSGEYQNGLKVGQWITTYKKNEIGGGTYDDRGVKIGKWSEVHANFIEDQIFNILINECQLIDSGEYKNGLKVGQWITTYKKDEIGGGTYDDRGVKIGNWTELHEYLSKSDQRTYSGQYKNGLKVGQWTEKELNQK